MALALTERDRRILLHVRRYRMTTRRVLHRLFWPSSEEGMKTRVRDLTGPYLVARPLVGRERYYQLTADAARLAGDASAAEPLGTQACARAYALLAYCCLGARARSRYRRDEFGEDFPDLLAADSAFAQHDYVLDEDDTGTRRLVRVLIDYGAEAATVLAKCRKVLRHAAADPAFGPHYQEGRFVVAVLTSEKAKRATLDAALDAEGLAHVLPVEVIPNLGPLLHQVPRGAEPEAQGALL